MVPSEAFLGAKLEEGGGLPNYEFFL